MIDIYVTIRRDDPELLATLRKILTTQEQLMAQAQEILTQTQAAQDALVQANAGLQQLLAGTIGPGDSAAILAAASGLATSAQALNAAIAAALAVPIP